MPIDYEKVELRAVLDSLVNHLDTLTVQGMPVERLDTRLKAILTRARNLLKHS